MPLRNTTGSYGSVAKLLHWVSALMLVGLVIVGLVVADMEAGLEKQQLEGIHISVGLLLLVLMTVRLAWKFPNPSPTGAADVPGWQKTVEHLTHWGLYVAVFFQILVGIISEGQRPIAFFGLFEFGPIVARDQARHEFLEQVHAWGWSVIAVLAGVHVLAVLYHQFIQKDAVLRRMTTA